MFRLFGILLFSGLLALWARPDEPESKSRFNTHVFPEELPGTFTGGFGEESCHSCHFDYPLNPEKGSLSFEGVPKVYEAGKSYIINITLKRDGLEQVGFQMSSRFEDGTQAGLFQLNSKLLQFTQTKRDIQYIQHSAKGPENLSGWEIHWKAPEKANRNIIFNISANAGNGDASAFGDFIYVQEKKSAPAN